MPRPLHLDKYDWFGQLEAWRAAGGESADPALRRWWQLNPGAVDRTVFQVRLEYPGTTWVMSISKLATSVEEAVWLAMEEWDRTPTCGRRPA